ncbi:unnamed protein product, partial [Closterium sp. NIES-53]
MASRVLVSGLPRSLPPLPLGPAPTCVPCVEGRQRAAPHSSEFPPTEAPLQTLHMDVWGPARVRGQGHECYFLLVVDDYSRYTTFFPLRSKGDVTEVLIDWIRAARLHLRESFGSDFPMLRITLTEAGSFPLPVWELSVVHRASARHSRFRPLHRKMGLLSAALAWSWTSLPRVSLQETSPTLRWTGKVGDVSAFRVWGSRAFVRDLSADKLSPRGVPCVFLGFPPDAPGWHFYHPTSRRVLSSQDVTFDESVPYYRLFPYRTAPLPPPPLFLAPGPPPVDPLPPQGPAPSGVSQVDAVEPVEVAVDSGAATGAEPAGAGSRGAEPGGAEPGGAESRGAEPWGAAPGGAEPGGAKSGGAESGAFRGTSSRRELLSPQELHEWFARRWSPAAGAGGTTVAAGPGGTRTCGSGAAGTGGAAEAAGVGPAGGAAGAAGGTGAAGPAGSGAAGGVGAGGFAGTGAMRARPYFVPLLEQVLCLPPSTGRAPPLACPQPIQSRSQLQPASPLPVPSPYTGPTVGLAERREPASRPASPVRAARPSRRAPHPRPPAVPGTHQMALRPSTAPLRVPLPSPPESSLPVPPDPESDSLRAASRTATCLLATLVTDPSFESTAASALVAELVDFAARCRLHYATSLFAASKSVCPPSVGGECALSADVFEDRQEEFQCFAAALPHLVSTLLAPEGDPDAPDIPTPRSYAEAGHLKVLRTSGLGLVLGGRSPVVLTGHADASWVDDLATQWSSQGYTFSLGSGSVSWRSTRSSSVLSSSCEAEIYAGAMAAQELRWLTYLLTDLGELRRSPPVPYVDNKAMLALCREHRLEHRTKHIVLRYFLARELQQRCQLRLAYVASQANTADIFTKALQPCDHQRFCTMLACFALPCFALLDWS